MVNTRDRPEQGKKYRVIWTQMEKLDRKAVTFV